MTTKWPKKRFFQFFFSSENPAIKKSKHCPHLIWTALAMIIIDEDEMGDNSHLRLITPRFSRQVLSDLVQVVQLVDGTADEEAFCLGAQAASGHEADEETRKEERIHQKMVDLRRRRIERGRYLKTLRNQPKVSMIRVSRADALEEIEKGKRDSGNQE